MVSGEKNLTIKCACGKALQIQPEAVGKQVRCPGCHTVLLVTRPASTPDATQWQQRLNVLTEKLEKTQAKLYEALKEKEVVLKEKGTEIKRLREELDRKEAELKEIQTNAEKMKYDYEAKIAQREKDTQDKIHVLEKVRTQLIKISQQID